MHLAVHPPKAKSWREVVEPASVAAVLFVVGVIFIPTSYPVDVEAGYATPKTVRPGEQVAVDWRVTWNHLCQITVTREWIDSAAIKHVAAKEDFEPPKSTGTKTRSSDLTIPLLPPGQAYYRATIEPHCWVDSLWQRSYRTPDVAITVLPAVPPGPR